VDYRADESPTEYVNAYTYDTNIIPAGPDPDAASDVTDTPFTGTGTVPACNSPAFGPPAARG
jgi:hypothetical protein